MRAGLWVALWTAARRLSVLQEEEVLVGEHEGGGTAQQRGVSLARCNKWRAEMVRPLSLGRHLHFADIAQAYRQSRPHLFAGVHFNGCGNPFFHQFEEHGDYSCNPDQPFDLRSQTEVLLPVTSLGQTFNQSKTLQPIYSYTPKQILSLYK